MSGLSAVWVMAASSSIASWSDLFTLGRSRAPATSPDRVVAVRRTTAAHATQVRAGRPVDGQPRLLPSHPQRARNARPAPRQWPVPRHRGARGKDPGMGCLLALLAGFAPRVALVLVWIFSNLVDRAYNGFLIPLLGLILFPYATLFYVLAYSPRHRGERVGLVLRDPRLHLRPRPLGGRRRDRSTAVCLARPARQADPRRRRQGGSAMTTYSLGSSDPEIARLDAQAEFLREPTRVLLAAIGHRPGHAGARPRHRPGARGGRGRRPRRSRRRGGRARHRSAHARGGAGSDRGPAERALRRGGRDALARGRPVRRRRRAADPVPRRRTRSASCATTRRRSAPVAAS